MAIDTRNPVVISIAGVCLAGTLLSASFGVSRVLTNRFVGFGDDYTAQQVSLAVREVFQRDMEMIRFARSIPMREEPRLFFATDDLAALDSLLDVSSAADYGFEFALVFENGAEFRAGYEFQDDVRREISEANALVALLSKAIEDREINRPTGFVVADASEVVFCYACPLRLFEMGGRRGRANGLVFGRRLSRDGPLSPELPSFTVRFLEAADFERPPVGAPFQFSDLIQEGGGLGLPPEIRGDFRRGGPGGPGGPGGGRPRGGRGGEFSSSRFLDAFRIERFGVPSSILASAQFYQGAKPRPDRDGVLRTHLYATVDQVIPDASLVIEMLLPRDLSQAVSDSVRLVQWTFGGVALLVCLFTYAVVREIHRRRDAEFGLVVSNQELRDANEKKDRLLSIIAHDLRAPLSGVVNLAGLMLKAPESFSPDEIRGFALDIQSTSKQLTELLENLLNWARLQIGKLPYVPVSIDVSKMVHQIVVLFEPTARQQDVELGLEVADGLRIVGDQEMLRTVLRNLVGNAIQHSDGGGLVVVSAEETGGYVAIRVTDSGKGLSQERLATLFELPSQPMLQSDQSFRGAGFGLILCKELVDRLEGHLAVDSEENEGTTFTVCIPARLDVASAERLNPEAQR